MNDAVYPAHLVRITRPDGTVTTITGPMAVEVFATVVYNTDTIYPYWCIGGTAERPWPVANPTDQE